MRKMRMRVPQEVRGGGTMQEEALLHQHYNACIVTAALYCIHCAACTVLYTGQAIRRW